MMMPRKTISDSIRAQIKAHKTRGKLNTFFGGYVTGILEHWRQLGRRYFWPHLLFGMIAASFGLPALNASAQTPISPKTAASISGPVLPCLQSLVSVPVSYRRPSLTIDYWHQHVIRTVIRQLSFAAKLPKTYQAGLRLTQQDILLDQLSALLTLEGKPPVIVRTLLQTTIPVTSFFSIARWLGQVQGTRAGPHRIS